MSDREYTNGEITVTWEPTKCIHSGRCVHGLPQVFDVHARPWVNIEGATSEQIEAQIAKCPSGALGCYRNSTES